MDKGEQASYGPTNARVSPDGIERYCSVIGLNLEKEQAYRTLHANAWPAVVSRLRQSNIQNYSIHIAEIDDKKYLFSYFEYVGDDFDRDMQAISNDEATQRWWRQTDPCQLVLDGTAAGERWKPLEQVFWMA